MDTSETTPQTRRIIITDATRARLTAGVLPPSCNHCGDDLDLHEWVVVALGDDAETVLDCDRA